jgi:flagellar biosynthetic protein FliQ
MSGGRTGMTGPEVMDVAREAVFTLLLVAGPVMLVGLSVGLIVSLFQSLTQLQEMTLVFVPKILAIFASLAIFLPFMGNTMFTFMETIAARIASLG